MKLTTQTPHTQDQNQPAVQQQPITTKIITQNTPKSPHAISKKYVTFYNDVNSTYLGKLGTSETNLLFAIFNKLKDKQDDFLVLSIR
ncbi:hypothetical protein [Helicobacter felis]|uniref:Replication initiation protein A n=1 Tax=Helicobacter felis (strain ATCC 49179 / CCUG 28539 / NCTC 12436 / CS1) TaxID=936155 RepID=E7ABK7_HELFC|nr:hypothetical protein [Helicobacter felis]CBY83712.1 replication initiation protein A [Helicobacter felis ATCC 49179]